MFKKLFVTFLLISASGVALTNNVPASTTSVVIPYKNSTNAVIFSKKNKHLTLNKAYHLQKAFVKNSVAKGAAIAGFKAELTASGAPEANGLHEPISGVLLLTPIKGAKAEINLEGAINPSVELEFAYQISQAISDKISIDDLPAYISHVAPAIEIPQMNFPSNNYIGLDLIANNAMGYKLAIGEWQPLNPFNQLDIQAVSLSCNGAVLIKGKGANVMGGQAKALVWLINNIIDHGYKIQKNQVLITGNIVSISTVKPCAYQANFGRFGQLDLQVSP